VFEQADDERAVFLEPFAMRMVRMFPDEEQAPARPRIFPEDARVLEK
jgi:hypothetical protein